MTAITRPAFLPRFRPAELLRGFVRGAEADAAWVRPAFFSALLLAAVLYVWNLTVSGYANTYYSAAALAASQSWSAWFFGSFDANNFITVDKPPLGTMLMGLSVRLFGLSSWSVLLPEAAAGVATVGVLFLAVKRSFGAPAATIAAVVMALTPAAVLIFRFNNPDGLLTLLLVVSAWALLRSLEHGSFRWVALAATCIGLAFLTKYLQAYLVLPGYALVFGFSANTALRRRIAGLLIALATVLVTSGWWVVIVEMLPIGSKPFIGGSTTGSPLDLIFGYDGLGRIFGGSGSGPGGAGGGAGGSGFSGEVGPLRLFNDQLFGQIAWFIPAAIVGLVAGLYRRRWSERHDPALAGYLLWGSWFAVTAITFSYMSGIIHSYYAVALAPAIAALVGAGLADLWGARMRIWLGGLAVGAVCLATAWFGSTLLDRTPTFYPGLGPAAIALAAIALVVLAATSLPALAKNVAVKRLAVAAAGLGLFATLLAPGAYALETIGTAYGGGDPHPGPIVAGDAGGFGGPGIATGVGLLGGAGAPGGPGIPPGAGGPSGVARANGGGGASADTALIDYLVANRGNATWIVAAGSAQEAGTIELATGLPVMAMGGFTGSDPAPTVDQLKAYVASGALRYVLAAGTGGMGFGGIGGTSGTDRTSWVSTNCTLVSIAGGSTNQLYDCAAAK
ncbi:MAG TPA: glycosyltransferase family 39 protein [Candidatus Limnocylindrales bacterium]